MQRDDPNGIRRKAIEAFGTAENAAIWLSNPQRSLQGRIPLEFIRTPAGAAEVLRVLDLIDHGDYL